MKQTTIDLLDLHFDGHPILVAGSASTSDVAKIVSFAGFPLPEDYRSFLLRYGAAMVGPYPVYGLGAAEVMGSEEASVIEVTEKFRREGWPGCDVSLVISMDHAGNPIMIGQKKDVVRFDHDSGVFNKVGRSFEDYLLTFCLEQ